MMGFLVLMALALLASGGRRTPRRPATPRREAAPPRGPQGQQQIIAPPPSLEMERSAAALATVAARELAAYLVGGGADPEQVKLHQRKLGGVAVDGRVGPQTRARCAALGVTLPARNRIARAVRG